MKVIIALLALCTSSFVMSTTPVRAQYGIEIGPGGVQVAPRDRYDDRRDYDNRRDREYRDERRYDDREARARRRCNRLVADGEYRTFKGCMIEQGY
jgi:hypothetical protein